MLGRRVTEERFTVSYDGPALETHSMDARDFASSVLALADMFREAQEILEPDKKKAHLTIEATQPGSFEVMLQLATDGWARFKDIMIDGVQPVINLHWLTTMVIGSVRRVKSFGDKKIQKATPDPADPAMVEVLLENGVSFRAPVEEVKLLRDIAFRAAAKQAISPLSAEGVDSLSIQAADDSLVVTKEDIPAFEVPDAADDTVIEDSQRNTHLQIVGLDFGETRKWRFTEGGGQVFSAAMLDQGFRDRIESHELAFGKFDILKAALRTKQTVGKDGRLRLEHEVIRVIEHFPAGRQVAFDFGDLSEEGKSEE